MTGARRGREAEAERWLLAFAAAIFVGHQVPTFIGPWVDLLTPFLVVGTAAGLLLALRARPAALAAAIVAAVAYVDGHGIHLAANAIGEEPLAGSAEDVAHFWDEQFGHIEWHLGWFALLASFCLAERGLEPSRGRPGRAGVCAASLLGFALFTGTVEGGTWPLELAATAVFAAWTARERRPLLVLAAGGFALAAVLIGVWAAWHGGVPQFSEVGWI